MPAVAPSPQENLIELFPQFLPDGRRFLYHSAGVGATATVFVGSLDATTPTRVMEIPNIGFGQSSPVRYVTPGYLLFSRDRTLRAQAFDASRLTLSGEAIPIAENVNAFSASDTGILVYRSSPAGANTPAGGGRLLWRDRQGKPAGEVLTPVEAGNIELSRDGQRIVMDTAIALGPSDIWVIDSRGVPLKITSEAYFSGYPVWSPDDSSIAFLLGGNLGGNGSAPERSLVRKASNGVGMEQVLFRVDGVPTAWSDDDKYIVVQSFAGGPNKSDIWTLPTTGEKKPSAFVETAAYESQGQISPDGQYLKSMDGPAARFCRSCLPEKLRLSEALER